MEHQVFGTQLERALNLSAKGGDALFANLIGLAANIDQVARVDDQRAYVELGAKLFHAGGLRWVNLGSTPHTRAGGKDLESVGADLARFFYGARCAAGCA